MVEKHGFASKTDLFPSQILMTFQIIVKFMFSFFYMKWLPSTVSSILVMLVRWFLFLKGSRNTSSKGALHLQGGNMLCTLVKI